MTRAGRHAERNVPGPSRKPLNTPKIGVLYVEMITRERKLKKEMKGTEEFYRDLGLEPPWIAPTEELMGDDHSFSSMMLIASQPIAKALPFGANTSCERRSVVMP